MMPVVSLNTSGTRPLKSGAALKGKGDEEPVHYDSKVDQFNKRLQLVRRQRSHGDETITEEELRDLSLYEYFWKYNVFQGRIKRSGQSVCLMVTPSFSADCASVEHAVTKAMRGQQFLRIGDTWRRSAGGAPSMQLCRLAW